MTDLLGNLTQTPEPKSIVRGRISKTDGTSVYAVLPAFSAEHEFGPMEFEHAAEVAVGDKVLVAFDEADTPWIASWRGVSFDMATQAELDAHAALTTTAHGGIVSSADSRLTNARTPTAHASTHASAGSDPITISESQVTSLVADLALKAPLASPTFTSVPAAPTAAVDTNTTQLATTAFVLAQAASATPASSVSSAGTAVVGTSTRFARADHVHKITAGSIVDADINAAAAIGFAKLAGWTWAYMGGNGNYAAGGDKWYRDWTNAGGSPSIINLHSSNHGSWHVNVGGPWNFQFPEVGKYLIIHKVAVGWQVTSEIGGIIFDTTTGNSLIDGVHGYVTAGNDAFGIGGGILSMGIVDITATLQAHQFKFGGYTSVGGNVQHFVAAIRLPD